MAVLDERFLTYPPAIENAQLVAAMAAVVKHDVPLTRRALYEALLESTLILPTVEETELTSAQPGEDDDFGLDLRLLTYEGEDGSPLLIAFTDENAVLAWNPEGISYVALSGPDLFTLADYNEISEIILNPAGPVGGRILRQEVESLARGELPVSRQPDLEVIPARSSVLIGKPTRELPEAHLDEMRRVLAHDSRIVAAYLFELHTEAQTPRLVVGVVLDRDLDDGTQDDILETLAMTLGADALQVHGLDLVLLSSEEFVRIVRDTVLPLYERN